MKTKKKGCATKKKGGNLIGCSCGCLLYNKKKKKKK
jgi:hypothetical protein